MKQYLCLLLIITFSSCEKQPEKHYKDYTDPKTGKRHIEVKLDLNKPMPRCTDPISVTPCWDSREPKKGAE